MNLRYLGTAAAEGWPALFCNCEYCHAARKLGGKNIRTRSQAVVDETLLIDFPPDTYMHMLHHGLNLPQIQHCIVTHTHQDHLYLPELHMRYSVFAHQPNGTLTFYGNKALGRMWDDFSREDRPQQEPHIAHYQYLPPYEPTAIGDYTVTAMHALHNRAEDCYIYLIQKDGKTILYGNDTGFFPDDTWAYLRGVRIHILSLDCTCIEHRDGTNHMGIADCADVKKRLADMGCVGKDTACVLAHFSHNGHLLHDELVEVAAPLGFSVAYDGYLVSK